MKIFAYIGSYRGENSSNYIIVNEIINKLKEFYEIELILRTPQNTVISECRGCCNCFLHGQCELKDDINIVKKEMLEADMIIFASPVYVHGVSGNLKTFIDRIGHWTHTMELTGKTAICINISSDNGNILVENYLSEIMNYLGLFIIDSLSIMNKETYPEALNSLIDGCVKKIRRAYRKNVFITDSEQEMFYQKQKQINLNSKFDTYETNYWKSNDIKDFHSFQEFYDTYRNKQIKERERGN